MAQFRALRTPDFLALWLAQCTARLGDSIHEIALIWIVYEVTGNPSVLALVVAASALPTAVSSLPAGTLIDRANRKHVLIASSVLRGVLVLAIPVTGPSPSLVPVVLAVAVTTGILEAFAAPARGAMLPALVPPSDLDAANALFAITQSLTRMLYVIGGLAIALVGSFTVFYLAAGLFILAGLLLLRIPTAAGIPETPVTAHHPSLARRIITDMRTGIGFVRSHHYLPSVIYLSLLTTLAMAPLAVVLPFYIDTATGGGSVQFGLLYGAIYLGVIIGAIGIGAFDRFTAAYRGPIILAGIVLIGIALIIVALVPTYSNQPLQNAFLAFTGLGIAFTLVNTPIQTFVQTIVPDHKRGIVFAVLAAVTLPALPLGAILAGPLVQYFTPTLVLLAQGVLLVLISVPIAFTPLARVGGTLNA